MKVSGCTYLRNGEKLGYPFVESIRAVLPIVDEFIIALGPCEDNTEARLREIGDPKIRIIHTQWNEHMRINPRGNLKAFVCGQQRSIALFNCTGDWAFYLDADEIIHENDLSKIRGAMEKYLDDKEVEALVFDYIHFYGNVKTYGWSPRWYRAAARIVRNTVPYWTPKGMGFVILESQKRGRWPRAAHTGATIYHYGWVRSKDQMDVKVNEVRKYGRRQAHVPKSYADVDPLTLREFTGTHPKIVQPWLPPADGVFQADPNHRLTRREQKHRLMLRIEQWFGVTFNKKHYRIIR
jgi:glycosyltransferase involved in cell wall biosynthesis